MTEPAKWRVDAYAEVERALRLPMLVLTVAVIPLLAISLSEKHLSAGSASVVDGLDWTIWAAFAAEYVVLLTLAPQRWTFVRTHVLELLLVAIPFLRPLRIVRGTRLFRASRAARLGVAGAQARRLSRKHLVSRGLMFASATAIVVLLVAAAAVLDAEQHAQGSNIHNFDDATWWAISTVTTVGYGDHVPVTAAGRGIAVMLMLVGIALIGVITAAIAAWFVKETTGAGQEDEVAALRREVSRLADLIEARDRVMS